MTRDDFLQLWRSTWDGDGWFASWKKGLERTTAAHALWKPGLQRHSIWQNVNHVIFWRRVTMCDIEGRPKPDKDETERMNFAEPQDKTEAGWKKTLADLEKSHHDIEGVIADSSKPIDRIKHHLVHDAYRMGQIQLLLAMQGMSPVL